MTLSRLLFAAAAVAALTAAPAQAQDYLVGQVLAYGIAYCPKGTLDADGQILPIRDYTALYSLYGTSFGGDGRTTFALPDLRGRSPIGQGQGPGLAAYRVGQQGGAEKVQLALTQLAPHTHPGLMLAAAAAPNVDNPTMAAFGVFGSAFPIYNSQTAPNVDMAADTLTTQVAGGETAVGLAAPYLVVRYCVVINGSFPRRP